MGTDKEKTLQHNWEITKRLHVTSLIILGRKEEVNEEKCTFHIAFHASISPLLLPQTTCNVVWRRNKGQVCSIHIILLYPPSPCGCRVKDVQLTRTLGLQMPWQQGMQPKHWELEQGWSCDSCFILPILSEFSLQGSIKIRVVPFTKVHS